MGDLGNFEINVLFDPSADTETDSCFFDSSAEAEDDCLVDIHYETGTTRIPDDLIALKPEAYKPHKISLGPLHFDDFQLKGYEEKKKQLFQARFPYRVRDFNELVDSMTDNLSRIRQWYPISDSFKERKLGSMMALDGIFLLQFLREIYPMSDVQKHLGWMKIQRFVNLEAFSDLERNVSPDLRKQLQALTVQQVQEDIMKLRNQIPLFVLAMILDWERKTYNAMQQRMLAKEEGKEKDKMLQDMMHQVRTVIKKNLDSILSGAWQSLSPFPDMDINEDQLLLPGKNAHILEFVYENILGERADRTQFNGKGEKQRILPAKAVALDKKGVKFAAYTGPLNKIHFDRKTWTFHLPKIEMTERTDAVMRNLVAFELFGCEGQTKPIKRYVELMDQLIDTAEDVAVLRDNGIITYHLGSDQEVADIWNKMREGHEQRGKYGPIDTAIDEVIKFYGSYGIWYAEGVKKFFSNPWVAASFIAGCIIGFTAILQTIFSGLLLHHH